MYVQLKVEGGEEGKGEGEEAKGAPFLRGTFDEDCTRRNARSKLVLSYLRTAGSHRKVNLSSR